MIDGEQLKAFWKRWDYVPDEGSEFNRFRTRLDELLEGVWQEFVMPYDRARRTFALISGTYYLHGLSDDVGYEETILYETIAGKGAEPTLPQIVEVTQFLLWTLQDHQGTATTEKVCARLNQVFDLSPNIQIHATFHGGKALLYPVGAKFLDEGVIEGNLSWLENYPQAAKPFAEALKLYMRKEPNQYRNMLDSLRLSVEELVRAVLKNTRSLENQKEDFLRWLKSHGAHSQIVNTYHDLLFGKFALYQNEAVKHHEDDYTPAEVEFLLYWTGALIRFIQSVNEQPALVAGPTK